MLAQLVGLRDKVLAGAGIGPADVVLDVGCGDGLLGVGALDLVGGSGTVIFSDISLDLLEHCQRIVSELELLDRSRFVHTGLPELADIGSGSVDVVMTRSVLIYVEDKLGSLATLHRVLRPGGRLSIFEPINRFGYPEPASSLLGLEVAGLERLVDKVKDVYRRYQPAGNSMVNFDERDLLAFAEAAGFGEVHMDYHVDVDREPAHMTWSTLLGHAPNPLVPPLRDVLDEALTEAERDALSQRLQEELIRGSTRRRFATAYLTAIR